MKQRLIRFWASVAILLLGFIGVSALETANAADASRFDPGLIISDSVFYDFGTMTVEDIQRFLESKVPVCKANDGGPTCLRDYVMDTGEKTAEDGKCAYMPAKTAQRASQIIYDIARACGINPRVLIVTLQKEQGLIQAVNPTAYMYRAALGYGCPDSDPGICGKVWSGLFNQLYKAAGQLQWYNDPRGSFTYLKVGRTANIRYNPSSSCGTKPVTIKSEATAALYYYTPYTPNDAALKNLYSTGDSCSAYGNRNFWRFYTDWFGSTIGGGFLLKSATSDVYLIVDNQKFVITDPSVVAAMKPLGPVGTISQAYLDSFTTAGSLGRIVKSVTNQYYFFDDSQKFTLSSCAQAATFGLDCANAVQLTSSQLAALANGGAVSELVPGDTGDLYLISNGQKRQLIDITAASAAGISLPSQGKTNISAFNYLPWGTPIINERTLFTNATTGNNGVFVGGQYFEIDKATSADINFAKWFTQSASTMTSDGLSKVNTGVTIKTIVASNSGQHYMLTSDGKRPIELGTDVVVDAPVVSDAFLSVIPNVAEKLVTPVFMQTATQKTIYYVTGAAKRPTISAADRVFLAANMQQPAIQIVPASAIDQIKTGLTVVSPGSYLKSATSGNLFWITSLNQMMQVPSTSQATLFGLAKPRTAKAEEFKGYKKIGSLTGMKVVCAGQNYVAVAGKYWPIKAEYAVHYPGATVALADLACLRLKTETTELGRFIKTADKRLWLVQTGKKRLIANTAQYISLLGDTPPAVAVDTYFAGKLTTGAAAPAVLVEPTPTPKPTATATPTPTASASATPKPSVTATPKPTATATVTPKPTASPTVKPKTYTVASGDSLQRIATRFSITLEALMKANNITNANLIRIGQILVIP